MDFDAGARRYSLTAPLRVPAREKPEARRVDGCRTALYNPKGAFLLRKKMRCTAGCAVLSQACFEVPFLRARCFQFPGRFAGLRGSRGPEGTCSCTLPKGVRQSWVFFQR